MVSTLSIRRYTRLKPVGYVDIKQKAIRTDMLFYNLGENTEGVPLPILREWDREMRNVAIHKYPDQTYSALVDTISTVYGVRRDAISVGAGANELIERLARTYLAKGDIAALLVPTFFRFADASLRAGAALRHVPLRRAMQYDLTEREINRLCRKSTPKVIWICNPNNPTGRVISRAQIARIARRMPHTLICVDEAHGEYLPQWDVRHSAIRLLSTHKNLIVLRTLSKYYGMAGLVVGYAIGNPKLIAPLNHMRLEFPVNALGCLLGVLVLKRRNLYGQYRQRIIDERTRFQKRLSAIPLVQYIPSSTGMLLLRHKRQNLYTQLYRHGILVTDLNAEEGICGERYIRITIHADKKSNDRLLDMLAALTT